MPTGAGLRPGAKAPEEPPDPTGGAPALDPTGERGEETYPRDSACGPVAKAPDKPPTPTGYAPLLDSTDGLKTVNEFGHIGPYISRNSPASFIVILDEHDQRSALIAAAARSMYGHEPRRHLIEPPFHLESHRYQTLQAADWIAGLVGRLGAIWAAPADYPENEPFRRYFEHRINRVSRRSGIRTYGSRPSG